LSVIRIVLIALGLAADAFAVSVAEGIVVEKATHRRHAVRVAMMFGGFQAAMPILGWLLGNSVRTVLAPVEHWVAFGLLGFIGAKMLFDALTGAETEAAGRESRGLRLLMLGVATSIDAFAVGLTLAMLHVGIWIPAAIIGVLTGVLSAIGVHAGDDIGTRLGRRAEAIGGLILLGLGVKILIDHLFGGV